jgi:fatty-acyl-CoA synthase
VIRLGEDTSDGMLNFSELPARADAASRVRLDALGAMLRCDHPVSIRFMPGTTVPPRAVTFTHRNILNSAHLVAQAARITEVDRVCIPLPLHHELGAVIGNLGCLTQGAAIVYPAVPCETLNVLATVQAERCTALHGVPAMFLAALEHPRRTEFDLRSLRTGVIGGAYCPTAVTRRVATHLRMRDAVSAYGAIGSAVLCTQGLLVDPVSRTDATAGGALPQLELRIVDADGHLVSRGTRGKLCVRGHAVMRGYWGDETGTREAIDAEGWLATGDLATMSMHGQIDIVGRDSEMQGLGSRDMDPWTTEGPKLRAS